MGLLDEFKKQLSLTEDTAKLKVMSSLVDKRIKELETPEGEEMPVEESPEETPEEAAEAPAEESLEETTEEEPVEEEPVKKPTPKKVPPAPKFRVGMAVYGPPSTVKFAVPAIAGKENEYPALRKNDEIAFSAKIEKIEGDKAIINYTDLQRSKAMGNPPKRVRVALLKLEPVESAGSASEESDEIPEED